MTVYSLFKSVGALDSIYSDVLDTLLLLSCDQINYLGFGVVAVVVWFGNVIF
jgi:hypothetical protein